MLEPCEVKVSRTVLRGERGREASDLPDQKSCRQIIQNMVILSMKLDRTKTTLIKQTKQDDCFVNASFQERISFVWELTSELWSLKGDRDAERRLQRHVGNLIRQ